MEIGIDYKLEKVALRLTKDEQRVQMGHINVKGNYAVATDGHMMAYVPVVKDEEDVDGLMSIEALRLARKAAKVAEDFVAVVKLTDIQTLENGITIPRPVCDPYPNTDSIIDGRDSHTDDYQFAISPKLLLSLAEAIGAPSGVILKLSKATREIMVVPNNETNQAFGILAGQTLPGEDAKA